MHIDSLSGNLYEPSNQVLVAVDCVIFGFDVAAEKLKLLLFKREVAPFQGEWSLIGSFVRPEEDLDEAAKRVLKEITGLENLFLEQHKSYGKASRDPGGRVISISYWSLIQLLDPADLLNETHEARWFEVGQLPEMVIDHAQMVKDTLHLLMEKSRFHPIGFELLPKKFTLPQLLKLYQEIFQRPLDDRNFRKKILSTGILKKLETKDKSTSKKGAFHYQFDQQKYRELSREGFNFQFG